VGLWFTWVQQQRDKRLEQAQRDRDRQLAEQRAQTEREIARENALDNQREAELQVYIEKIFELVLKLPEATDSEDTEIRRIAKLRTLTVLSQLDIVRTKRVFQFLHDVGLVGQEANLIDFSDIDFSGNDLSGTNLFKMYLARANLSKANLSGAALCWANLSGANLTKAKLSSTMVMAANLSGADLTKANLSKAEVMPEQLKQVKSLEGTTMPNGSKHPHSELVGGCK
jgi:uncharacterized protein YjbI with pentapeptide repeats